MNRLQWRILAGVSGLVVCAFFIYFFKDRLEKIIVILIGAALAMAVAEIYQVYWKKSIKKIEYDISN